MIKLLLFLSLLFTTSIGYGQKRTIRAGEGKAGNPITVYTLTKSGETLYCLPRKEIGEQPLSEFRVVALVNSSAPAIKTSLVCYQCCVGESPHSVDTCKMDGFDNFNRGKDCGCK